MRTRPTLLALTSTLLALGVAAVAVPESQAHAVPRCHGKAATIVGRPGATDVDGTPRADVIVTGPGSHEVTGGGGNDTICGGRGVDDIDVGKGRSWVDGGAGDDLVIATACRCVIRGGAGNDDVVIHQSAHVRVLGGSGSDRVTTTGKPWVHAQSYAGGPGRDWLTIRVAKAPDGQPFPRFVLDLARGWYAAAGARVAVTGFEWGQVSAAGQVNRADSYVLRGTDSDNVLSVFLGDRAHLHPPAIIRGRGGDDRLLGSRGDDVLDGGPGFDRGEGGPGNDTCVSIEAPLRSTFPTCETSRP